MSEMVVGTVSYLPPVMLLLYSICHCPCRSVRAAAVLHFTVSFELLHGRCTKGMFYIYWNNHLFLFVLVLVLLPVGDCLPLLLASQGDLLLLWYHGFLQRSIHELCWLAPSTACQVLLSCTWHLHSMWIPWFIPPLGHRKSIRVASRCSKLNHDTLWVLLIFTIALYGIPKSVSWAIGFILFPLLAPSDNPYFPKCF